MIKFTGSKVLFSDTDIIPLAKKIATPFFLFSEQILEENYKELKKSFSAFYPKTRVDFSVKTNNELVILKILKRLGSGAEISCGHELYLAKLAGFSPDQITFDGPGKKKADIDFALSENIHAFYADSCQDLKKINDLAENKKVKTRVAIRINLGLKSILLGIAEAFIDKFGVPENEALQAYRVARNLENLEIIGITTHLGSQILAPEPYLKAIDKLTGLAQNLEKEGVKISEINLGGGYPSQTLIKTTLPNLFLSQFGLKLKTSATPISEFGQIISSHFGQKVQKLKIKPTLALQPGRSITSSMGIAVAKVEVVKKDWVFLDISTSSLPESLFFCQREIILAKKIKDKKVFRFNVAGCGLNSADNLGLNIKMPKPEVGDIVIILDAGAYSISRANRFTILNPPVYLVTKEEEIKLIRRAENYEDIISPMQR